MTTRRSFLAASTAAAAGAFISKGASAADVATTQLPAKWDAETDVLVAGSIECDIAHHPEFREVFFQRTHHARD